MEQRTPIRAATVRERLIWRELRRSLPYGRGSEKARPGPRCRRPAFTIVELLVVTAIIVLLLAVIGAAWRPIIESNREAKALNTISTFASVARTYAMRHQLETVLTVNPRTGQLDLFVWNAQPTGGNTAYVYAPVLDDTARLPAKGDDLAVRIAPIDYDEQRYVGNTGREDRNLSLFTLCFDPKGRAVHRPFIMSYDLPANDPNAVVVEVQQSDFQDDPNQWVYVESARGGIAYVPAVSGADPGDPDTVTNAVTQTAFMLNQYSGRIVKEARP